MMEDYYTIQTAGHHSKMFAELHTLQKQGVMCDVILAAEDGEVMAHKVVLMAASKYFREKLSPVIGPTASKICLKGISVVELANLVKYIYTGKLLVAKETMDITLEISEILELNGVIQGYNEIISNEHKNGTKETESALKSQPAASGDGAVNKKPVETATHQSSQIPKSDQVATPSVSTLVDTVSSTSAVPAPEANQESRVVDAEQSVDVSTIPFHEDGKETDVGTNQYSSDYNFETLFDQQYMDVSAGSRTPSKTSGMNTPQAVVTPPKLQKMEVPPADSQKIAAERAQHQDLLAVAIESLSDVPHLRHHTQGHQHEVDKAVSTISSDENAAVIPQNVFKQDDDVTLEEYENGKTSTKTVTMSAGCVSNELGGKTDVYTVALDPASIKSPLKMPRPKRMKTVKEKEAELKAKMYRQKKAEILQAGTTSDMQLMSTEPDLGRGKRQRNTTTKQDFQYESLSKAKKKPFDQQIMLAAKNTTSNDPGFIIHNIVEKEIAHESANTGDDFGQVVNFDSDDNVQVNDDVDGMIADDVIAAVKGKSVTETIAKSNNNDSDNNTDMEQFSSYMDMNSKELSESEVLDRDSEDMTEEKIRSSATKRKTRTPRKLPLSDEEKGNDSGPESRENISVDRTKRNLNLEKENDKRITKHIFKPTEIKIIAQRQVNLNALGEEEHALNKSEFKKIIIVPKKLQPEIRLKKRTEDEMLRMAKGLTESQKASHDIDVENYDTGEDDDDDDDDFAETDVEMDDTHHTDMLKPPKDINKRKKDGTEEMFAVKKMRTDKESLVRKNNDKSVQGDKGEEKMKAANSSPVTREKAKEKQRERMETRGSKKDIEVDPMSYYCEQEDCWFSSSSESSLRRHEAMFHEKGGKGERSKKTTVTDKEVPISPDPTIVKREAVDDMEITVNTEEQCESSQEKGIGTDANVKPWCNHCGKIFKTFRILKKHMDYTHSDRKKLICEQCDFTTPFESSMSTHIMLKHALEKPILSCKYCSYETPLTGNLRKHILGTHGLFIVTKLIKKNPIYAKYPEGTILTKDGDIFDPEAMQLPKLQKKNSVKVKEELNASTVTETRQTTRIALNKLPVDDFLQEMMKRHEEYLNQPEKNYNFMSSSIAKATEHPSFPQASPQVRNTRANKIYNMKKLKPTLQQLQMDHPVTYGIGNLHGIDQGSVSETHGGIPQVASEVEVIQDNSPEVVVENVEADSSTAVLTISEHRSEDGSEMVVINQNGKQTVVRSKDFYDTLAATGHDSNQTLGVISALLQAGEQIEIREQEEIVEIQNM